MINGAKGMRPATAQPPALNAGVFRLTNKVMEGDPTGREKQKATEVAFIHSTFALIIKMPANLIDRGMHWFAVVA